MTHLRHAIVRPPSSNFADGLTSVYLGRPDFEMARQQHRAYCQALSSCGLTLTVLEPDESFPDSTFVEDTAVLTSRGAIITRPGAPSRKGEVDEIAEVIQQAYSNVTFICEPGTLDGGDVCEAGNHYFIGLSERTNQKGVLQLSEYLSALGFTSSLIDIRGLSKILHLKSGIASLREKTLVLIEELAGHKEFTKYNHVVVGQAAQYAANCVEINDYVLIASGYEGFRDELQRRGYQTVELDMSEFQKMDGGLSCLSLRF
ncbi:MAG: N(G),N(G)-dimethylarginine dimethylaminohydrolase [Blastocatellia bacterium]|nr:MAG: N(G),N(G)-dimethylarginine dimethylaminohydrolase [Blastocatellia bacterium]